MKPLSSRLAPRPLRGVAGRPSTQPAAAPVEMRHRWRVVLCVAVVLASCAIGGFLAWLALPLIMLIPPPIMLMVAAAGLVLAVRAR